MASWAWKTATVTSMHCHWDSANCSPMTSIKSSDCNPPVTYGKLSNPDSNQDLRSRIERIGIELIEVTSKSHRSRSIRPIPRFSTRDHQAGQRRSRGLWQQRLLDKKFNSYDTKHRYLRYQMAGGLNFEEFWQRWIDVNIKCLVPALPFWQWAHLGSLDLSWSCCQSPRSSMAKSQSLTQLQPPLGPWESWEFTGLGEFSAFRIWITRNRGWNPAGVQKHPCDGHGHRCHGNVVWSFVAANHVLPQFATSKVWCRRFLFCLFAYSFSLQEWSQIELA